MKYLIVLVIVSITFLFSCSNKNIRNSDEAVIIDIKRGARGNIIDNSSTTYYGDTVLQQLFIDIDTDVSIIKDSLQSTPIQKQRADDIEKESDEIKQKLKQVPAQDTTEVDRLKERAAKLWGETQSIIKQHQ